MSSIETLFRQIIGDTTVTYDIPSTRVWIYLDKSLDKLSAMSNYTQQEDAVITADDITAGYKDLSYEIVEIISTELMNKDVDWEVYRGKRIRFYDTSAITAGTYEFTYRCRYKKFEETDREDSYFDYPIHEADVPVVYYALALYQQEYGVINTEGQVGFITSKSEEGLSVQYGIGSGDATEILGNPENLMAKSIQMMKELPSATETIFSV